MSFSALVASSFRPSSSKYSYLVSQFPAAGHEHVQDNETTEALNMPSV